MSENKFIIIVPFYNASKWVGKSIKSVLLQDYDNFSCIVADDCSTDDSYQICERLIGGDDRFALVKGKRNLGPLGNAYEAATIHNNEHNIENIIVILDGDDFFSSENTLSILNECYIQNSDIIDTDGEYYKAAGDLAIMFPLLEMSGERAHFIKDVLYIWNDLNELNEHKDKRQLQISCEQRIRSLEKYKKLEEL